MKRKFSKIKRSLPASLFALLMLSSCFNASSIPNDKDGGSNNGVGNVERVDFNQVLKNITKGYEEHYNDQVLYSSAMPDAKIKNQTVTVIIEMEGDTTVDTFLASDGYKTFPEFYDSKKAIAQENAMVESQSKLAAALLKEGLVDEIYGNYSTLFNGFYGKTTYGRVEQIRSFANVKNAYVSTIYNRPMSVPSNETNVDPKTGIYSNDTNYDGSNTIVAVLDSGFDYTHEVFNMEIDRPAKSREFIESILDQTVAYQLQGKNLTIDDVYLSSKIPFAYDYAEKKIDVFPVESDHGTHVSGIIGGKSDVITGIAPNTQFAWMKVFSDDDGGGDSGDILFALEDAVTLGVDAINMSLGAVGGYSVEVIPAGEVNSLEERTNIIYKKIEDVGIALLTAGGNEYSSGYQSDTGTNTVGNPESGTISSPGSYDSALTVASINGTLDSYAKVNHSEDAVFFRNGFDAQQVEHKFMEELLAKIEASDLPKNADGSVDLEYVTIPGLGARVNYTGVNVKGKIALVERGNLSFEEKVRYAADAGAFACVIYNNVSGSLSITVGKDPAIPFSLITLQAGSRLSSRPSGTLTFHESFKAGPFMSDFSSWGPLADLKLKPEITAHGGFIYSSILGGSYDEMSGTSMATPNACGIVLVIRDYVKDTWPELSPKEVNQMVNRLLMSSATICLNEEGNPYSPRKQGAGLASLLNSVTTDAYLYVEGIDKTKLEIGDDKDKTGRYVLQFNVNNFSGKDLVYQVGNLTMTETVSTDGKAVAETAHMFNPDMSISVGSSLKLNGTTLTVPAGADDKVTITLQLSNAEKKYIEDSFPNGMYVEGFATLTATEKDQVSLNIPYLAFYGDWLNPPMFDKTYYEVEADRVNDSISEKDKTKADMYATTPYGKYGDYYMIPLGAYIYEIDAGNMLIPATQEKAAISVDPDCIYQLYTVYVGMLRGAKKMTMTITDDKTGKVVYEKITYNNRKSTYYGAAGGILPYNDDYSFDMFNQETGEVFANNTKLSVKMVAELDYENGDKVANNTFEFSFYVDYETPTVEKVNYLTEWDQTLKKNRYYIELDVSDNRFVQAIRPCIISNNTLISLVDNPIPVYQNNPNETTTVKVEITDFLPKLKESEYPDTIFFMVSDYALNSNLYLVSLAGCDSTDLAFTVENNTLEIKTNQLVNLNDYVNVDNAVLQGLTWRSSNTDIAVVDNAEVMGLKQGIAIITGISETYGTSVQVRVKVVNDGSSNNASISKMGFSTYTTIFSFDDDFEYSPLGAADNEGFSYSFLPASNSFEIYPSESFKLNVDIEPWYFDSSKISYVWSSSNPAYVSVSDDGVVTALKETVSPITIRATAYINGAETVFSASTSVNVKSPFITSGIVLQYYKGFGGVVEIPDDQGIQYIGEYAFSHYLYHGLDADGFANRIPIGDNTSTPITKIIVPEGVEIIQNYAFANLTHLEEVVLPSTIKDLYVGTFQNCTSLKKINLNHVNKIENFAFMNCTSLSNINEDGATKGNDLSNVITLGAYALSNTSIEKLDLIRLRMAGTGAISNNKKLKEVTLYKDNPLSNSMFANSAIESITIPHSVIASNAFANCSNIKEVNFTNDNVIINSKAFANCGSLQTINFASTSNSILIGANAFENSKITTLNLPSCDVTIADEAFADSSIANMVLNPSTKLIMEGTPFVSTNNFNSISINGTSDYYTVVNGMLLNLTGDTLVLVPTNVDVNIPNSVTTIGDAAIAGNKKLTDFVLPANITNVGNYAFAESSLTSIDLSSATNCTFETGVFYGAKNLTSVIGLEVLTNISDYMFAYSGLETVTLGDNVVISYGAFAGCESLTTVVIGNNAEVGEYAFYEAFTKDSSVTIAGGIIKEYAFSLSNLKTIIANVSEIGEGAFVRNTNLTTVEMPNILIVSNYTFQDCTSLTTVIIPSATEIGVSAFYSDTALNNITVNSLVTVSDFAFINTTSLTSIDLSSVKTIGALAFANSGLISIDLSSVETIDELAFMNCASLFAVNNLEKSSLTVINEGVFMAENNNGILESINLSKVTTIGDYAFYGQSALSTVNLESVVTVGDYAFFSTIVGSVILTNCTDIGDFAFYATPIRTLSIPKLVNVGECSFAEIYASKVDLPDTLVSMQYGSFSSIRLLSNYTHNGEVNYTKYDENGNPVWLISDGVLYMYLENGKLQLQSYPIYSDRETYTILEGTSRIDAYSFYGASKLTEVYLPYSLESIGDCAFATTENLKTYHFSSFKAPVLEGVYNVALQNFLYNLSSLTEVLDSLYFINKGPQYNMYFFYYPYYYANFNDYVGFVNDLTMYYPTNGSGYDSWIYRNFFVNKVADSIVADELTSRVMASIANIYEYESVTDENKQEIIDAYFDYTAITSKEQQDLLNPDHVAHLVALYDQIIDMDNPALSTDEIARIVGVYSGVDMDKNTYKLTINADGSGTFIVDNITTDSQDRSFTFDKIRYNSANSKDVLQISAVDESRNATGTFTFVIDEDGGITLRYYVSNIKLSKGSGDVGPNPVTPNNHLALIISLSVLGGLILIAAVVIIIIVFMKKRKVANNGGTNNE